MPRVIGGVAMAVAMVCAYGLYAISVSTRRIENEVHALERERERLTSELQVLKGDRAFHARPERIEPLARLQGLQPLKPGQIITQTEFERRHSR